MKFDVMISYSSKDSAISHKIKKYIESKGIKCWMAPESIPPGSNYGAEIPYGIENSDSFLLILSENAQNSLWVAK